MASTARYSSKSQKEIDSGGVIFDRIGGFIGYALNFVQEHYYNTRVGKKGAEARLYGAMAAGIALACGCFIYAWTSES